MEAKVVKSKEGVNDCYECCYNMLCIAPCKLEKGKHYEKKG